MPYARKPETPILFLGDILCLVAALWLTLLLRYLEVPPPALFGDHLAPFSFVFVFSIVIFFIAGLYEKRTQKFEQKLLALLFNAQVANSVIAIAYFYFFPSVGIEPRTILFIYILVSTSMLLVWRLFENGLFRTSKKSPAILIGDSSEIRELSQEINNSSRYDFSFVDMLEPQDTRLSSMEDVLRGSGATVVVCDTRDNRLKAILPLFYKLGSKGIRFIDSSRLYEDVFDRVALSSLDHDWFLEDDSHRTHFAYDGLKRVTDIVGVLLLSVVAIPVSLITAFMLKIFHPGPILISQERVGEGNSSFRLIKFRTWLFDDHGDQELHKQNRITAVGKILRKTRIDELPQLWNVVKGELSFIGPRPEIPALIATYEKEIPFYRTRHLIRPGLSGWAQINDKDAPREKPEVEKTARKLSYDLFYLEHRSFLLDMKIALRTIQTLLSRTGI